MEPRLVEAGGYLYVDAFFRVPRFLAHLLVIEREGHGGGEETEDDDDDLVCE